MTRVIEPQITIEVKRQEEPNPPWSQPLYRHISNTVDDTVEEVMLRHEYPDLGGLTTGIDCLDQHLMEATMPGELIVCVGATGLGKTAFGNQLAVAWAHQVPVLHITLEDEAHESNKRSLANLSRGDVGQIRQGFPELSEIPDEFWEAVDRLKSRNLYVIDGVRLTAYELAIQVKRWKEDVGVEHGAVVIDQLSHIATATENERRFFERRSMPVPPPPSAPRVEQLDWRALLMMHIAKAYDMTVLLMHQTNDVPEGQAPGLQNVKGARAISEHASAVLATWRPERIENPFYGPGEPKFVDAPEDHAYILGLKGRSIRKFKEQVKWNGSQQRFCDPGDFSGAYEDPTPRSEHAQEGAKKLAELRQQIRLRREAFAGILPLELPSGVRSDG